LNKDISDKNQIFNDFKPTNEWITLHKLDDKEDKDVKFDAY